jgi:D-ribose pyranase
MRSVPLSADPWTEVPEVEKDMRILNGQLAKAIVCLGHGEILAIADAGLPIPPGVESIDLSLVPGTPSFIDVLTAIAGVCAIEKALVANETEDTNPELYKRIVELIADNIPIELLPHQELKKRLGSARVIVRSGECTPYANIALIGSAPFFVGDAK